MPIQNPALLGTVTSHQGTWKVPSKEGEKKIRLSADTEELGFEIITQENEIINDILRILKQ